MKWDRLAIRFTLAVVFLGGIWRGEVVYGVKPQSAGETGNYGLNNGNGVKVSPEAAEQGEKALVDGAWSALEAANTRLMPPARWGKENKQALRDWAERERVRLLGVADQARGFVEIHGNDRRVTKAMVREFEALSSLSRLVPDEKERLEKVSDELLKRRDLPRKDRYGVRLQQVFRQAKNREELETGARSLIKEFGGGEAYDVLLLAASGTNPARGKALCEEILRSGAPPHVKERAKGMLYRLKAEGQPFDMDFTALDGSPIDMKTLRGKVILIDFWATWCSPCVEALPELKAVYNKWHKFGLQVIGVSLDSDPEQLKQFVQTHGLPWPIFFDGKGWDNLFANRYGVNSIPMVWLIDKKGVLRSVNVKGRLDVQVEELLKEGMSEEELVAAGFKSPEVKPAEDGPVAKAEPEAVAEAVPKAPETRKPVEEEPAKPEVASPNPSPEPVEEVAGTPPPEKEEMEEVEKGSVEKQEEPAPIIATTPEPEHGAEKLAVAPAAQKENRRVKNRRAKQEKAPVVKKRDRDDWSKFRRPQKMKRRPRWPFFW